MSKVKNGGLDQYGAGPFEQQQFETAGAERVKCRASDFVLWRGFSNFPQDSAYFLLTVLLSGLWKDGARSWTTNKTKAYSDLIV